LSSFITLNYVKTGWRCWRIAAYS